VVQKVFWYGERGRGGEFGFVVTLIVAKGGGGDGDVL